MAVYTRGSERVVSNRTSNKSLKGRLALAAAVSLTASGMWSACAEAARGGNDVKGAQVLAGAAQISNKGNTTTIRAIDKTIIRYDRFNIPKNGTVKFIQPSSSSRVLNKIDSATPSRIDGHFTANGIVFFVNPAGVMFGPTAVVDVSRLYAGAGTIGDQDFLGGINKFSTASGSVVNQGTITGEQVHLFGSQVVNRGAIVADGGIVTMSSGKDVFIGEEGGNIMVKVEGASSGKGGVVNSGSINVGKGVVRMTGAGDIYSIAVNTSGLIKAKDVAIDAGKGVAIVGGKIDASDTSAGGVGGKVTVTGGKVALIGATVDASGAAGGGTVLVGGDVHGGGTTPTATATMVSPNSTIKADAIDSGNGGKVVVWSDQLTAFGGKISAKGGANSGNGGFVEVSGKQKLIYNGQVNVTAAHGAAGTLLLDPLSITIAAAGNEDINGDATTGDDIATLTDLDDALLDQPGAASVISNIAVNGLLTGGNNLVLQAVNFITVNAAVSGSGDASLKLDAPTVNLNQTITLSGAGVLSGGATTATVNVGASGSIQNGVDVVANLGTVHVAAGTFNGNVSVGKSISLLGAQNGVDARGRVAAESIINGQVALTAPNTTLDGFTIQQSAAGAGVVASNAQGDTIVNNIITDNVFGLSLASDGSTQVLVKHNVFDTNTRPGSASGNAIYTDFTVSNVKVEANDFTGNTEGSVSFFGSAGNPQSNLQVVDNTMTDDGPISLETISNVTITGNTINNSGTHAIWIAGGVSNVTISNNFLENNGGAGVKFASVNIDPTPASNVTITNNVIAGNADGGIVINAGRYTGTLNATSNFWGSANGPVDGGNTFNVGAQGDVIVNPGGVTVNYVRWLTSGADQNGGTPGFQADAGSLFAPITLNGLFFSNIQAAHNAAAPGDTAVLASGTFTEAVTTTKNLTLQFNGDGTLANSPGTLTLGANLTITGSGSIAIAEDVSVGANAFVVDTQTAAGTTINITGPIHSTNGTVSILGQQTVTIGAAIDPPTTLLLSSLDDVVVNAAVQAQNLISVSAGEDGTGGLTIGAGGSLQATAAGGDISISTGTTSGNIALGGSVTALDQVAISTAGTVIQTAGALSALDLDIAGATTVNLPSTTNAITGAITIASSGNTTLFNNSATNLGSSTVGGNLSVTSTGAITDSGALAVTGSATFETRSNGTANITLDQPLSTFGSLTARSRNALNSANGSGNINIIESGTMDVTAVATGSGSITLDAAKINLGAANTVESSGTITLQPTLANANINLGTDVPGGFSFTATQLAALKDGFAAIVIGRSGGTGIVTVSSNVTLTDSVSIVAGSYVGGATLTTIVASNLSLQATTGGIGTLATPLNVSVGGTLAVTTSGAGSAGDVFVSSSSPLTLGAVATNVGSAQTVNIGGNGITVTTANAGSTNDNFTFTSTGAFTLGNVSLTGNTVSITAAGNITDAGTGVITTSGAGGLTLISSAGGIGVNVANPLGVSVGGTGVLTLGSGGTPVTGNVFITSPAALTLGAVNTSGAVQTIDVRTTSGNLKLNNSVTGNDNWVLNAAGTLNNNGTTLTAASVNADAAGGIGTTGSFTVATVSISADSTGGLVSVVNSSAAPVTIGSLSAGGSGDVNYSQSGGGSASFGGASTANGSITLINVGGGIALNGAVSAGGIGDATVATATSGDVTVNSPLSGVNVTINSAGNLTTNAAVTASDGAILGATGFVTTNALVSGLSVDIAAGGNVTANGNVTATAAATIDSGAVALITGDVSGASVGITSIGNTTADGNVTATGTAGIISGGNITGNGTVSGGTLNLIAVTGIGSGTPLDVAAGTLNASTSGGGAASINLSNSSGGTMTLSDVSTVGAGANITISQSGAGNRLRLVNVSAPAGNVTLSTAETINEALNDDSGAHTAEIIGVNANLIANNGIGTTSRLDLTVGGTVTVNTATGDASIANSIGLTLGASSVGGNLTAVAETGNFATTGAVTVGGTGVLTAQAGGATMNIGSTLTGGTGNLTLTADGGITLSSAVDGGNAFTATANSGNIIASADIGATTPPTSVNFSGLNISLQNVRSGAGNQAYTASGLVTLNGNDYRSAGGAISFNGNAVLAAPVVSVTSGGGVGDNISFSGTVNGATALTLAAGAGNVTIGGAAGGGTTLISVDASGNDITLHNVTSSGVQLYTGAGTITLQGTYASASGAITFDGDATLASAVIVNANGGTNTDDIAFTGTITGPGSLTATATGLGDVSIAGAGGVGISLGFAAITANDITIHGMATAGAQTYTASGLLTLAGTYSSAGGAITFSAATATLSGVTSVSTAGGTNTDDIVFTGDITGAQALTLTAAGAGDVVIGGNINVGSIAASGNDIGVNNVTTGTGQSYTASGTISLGGTTYSSTSGNVIFAGNALLSGNTLVSTGSGGGITFGGTLNGAHTLTLNTASGNGITTLGGVVGGTTPLTSVTSDADGTMRINAGAVTSTGDQIYNDAVTLGADTTINGNNITFASTVNSSGGARDLTVNAAAATTFGGAVGGISSLNNLIATAPAGIAINGSEVSTTEDQTYNNDVALGADVIISGNDVKFAGKVDGAHALTVNTLSAGVTTFSGVVGGGTALTSVTTNADGTTRINGGTSATVSTSGDQTYGDAVTLGADTTLNGINITFGGTLDSTGSARDLTVKASGATTFGGNVGGTLALKDITTDTLGSTVLGTTTAITITTSEDQTYNDNVTLGADTTLSGNDITFILKVDGAHALTVNSNTTGAAGVTRFDGAVGSTTPLSSLTTNANGSTLINGLSVSTSGAQAYGDAVTLGGDTILNGGSVGFGSTLNSDATERDLTINSSGVTSFAGLVGEIKALKNLITDVGGTTQINTTKVTTKEDQTYNDAVTLGADTTLSGNDIKFVSTVDGAKSLTVNSINTGTAGVTTFGGVVGGTVSLTSLTTNSEGTTNINGGAVTTSADQTYNDVVVLGADTVLGGGNVKFTFTLDSDAVTPRDLTVNTTGSGLTTFAGLVGGTKPLKKLITDATGTTKINGKGVTTTEDQDYKDAVTLGDDPTTLSGNDIKFESTLDADVAAAVRNLTINTSGGGVTTFGGVVGGSKPITSLTTNADGTTQINGGAVTTTAAQTYNDPVTLGANTTIGGVAVTFGSTVNSDATARNLTINDSGNTTFTGAVGGTAPIGTLLTNAGGSTRINGGAVTTTLNQTYVDNVIVGADTVFTGAGITFSNILNSDAVGTPRDVTVVGTGAVTFAGATGVAAPLKKLTVTAGAASTISLNGTAVTSTDDQIYNQNVNLGGNEVLTGKNIKFGGTLNGARTLAINTSGTGLTEFVGAVGGGTPLVSLTTNADGNTKFDVGTVTTTGAQSYGDKVLINADTTFTGIGISFGQTIESDIASAAVTAGRNLTIKSGVSGTTATGDITITGAVGGTSKIEVVDMTGKNVSIHSVHSAKGQTYTAKGLATINGTYLPDNGAFKVDGNASLGGGATVTTSGTVTGGEANDITFTGTIDGNHTLTLLATGLADVTVSKAVGGGTALGGFSAAAQTIDVASVKTKKTGVDADHTGVISLKVDSASPKDDTFDQDDKGKAADAFKPTGTITLHGGLESNGGDVFLGTLTPRSDTDIVAFPTISVLPAAKGTAVISGHNVTMGRNEKLVVDGSVSIVGTNQVILSDITAGDSISVSAPTVIIQQRLPGTVIASDGVTLLHDVNTDIVAKNSINFSGNVQVQAPPAGVTISSANRVLFGTAGNDVTGAPGGTSVRSLNPDLFNIIQNGTSNVLIDLRADGPSVTNPAAALAGAAPQESRQPEVENAVASSQALELRNLGIFARDMDRASLIGFLEGIVLYNDVPGGIASGETLPRESYQVTKNRLSYDGARHVLDLYYSTYFQTDEYGRPVMKNGKRVENITAMNKAIEDAITAYRAKTGQKTGSIDPVAFREYVETTPSQGEALKHMNKLRNLFNEILPVGQTSSRKGLGLTPVEAAISRKVLVESLGVQGMEPEKLEAAIVANTGRTGAARPTVNPVARPQANPAAKPAVSPTARPVVPPANRPEPKPTLSPIPRPESTTPAK